MCEDSIGIKDINMVVEYVLSAIQSIIRYSGSCWHENARCERTRLHRRYFRVMHAFAISVEIIPVAPSYLSR